MDKFRWNFGVVALFPSSMPAVVLDLLENSQSLLFSSEPHVISLRQRMRRMVNTYKGRIFFAVLSFMMLTNASAVQHGTDWTATSRRSHEPIGVIFDTDIWSDIDDMLALAMLHALHDRREVNLLAVTISTEDPWCASYVNLVNTFYGHPEIPVGIVRNGMNLQYFRKKYPELIWPATRYTEVLSQRRATDGSLLYPHRLTDGTKAAEAVSLLRKTLAAQPDESVVVIQVGYSTNLARLIDSKADGASPLDGRDLVAKKVRLLSVMAGNFRETEFDGKMAPKGAPEFNLQVDVVAAQKVFSSWPTPIVDSGSEIGVAMLYPGQSVEHDFSYVENHPIADTYRMYCNELQANDPKIRRCPQDHDHATCDLTAVLYAARPDGNYFSLSAPGEIKVRDDGSSSFEEAPTGQHRYLILSNEQKERALEAMVMLASQPPVHHADPR